LRPDPRRIAHDNVALWLTHHRVHSASARNQFLGRKEMLYLAMTS
jgi:hypothetical protein